MLVVEPMRLQADSPISPLVYVVTVNWNRPDDTIACLRSLRQPKDVALRLLVVDNGSTDNSPDLIRKACSNVALIEARHNLGFAGGFNLGIRHALAHEADYVFVVNNDTIADPGMLMHLMCQTSTGAGMLAPAIFYADSPECIWSVGGRISPLLLDLRDNHGRNKPLPDSPVARDFLSGCALLVRRDVFESVGLLDEQFFMYYEDLDFCLRAQQQGFRLLLVPRARLWHKVSQSSGGAESPNERYQMALSSGRYFRKHMHGWRWLIIPPYRLLSALRWTLSLATRHSWDALGSYWRGLLRGWLGY